MTTTSTQQGLQDNQRLSSRVTQPPGGGSSDIFGVGNTYSSPSACKPSGEETRTSENQPTTLSSANQFTSGPQNNTAGKVAPSRVEPSFKMRNRQGAFNPITGEPYTPPFAGAKQVTEEKEEVDDQLQTSVAGKAHQEIHTSSRVLNPPGGPTTRLW